MYEKIKRWYRQGLWTSLMVDAAAEKHIITKAQAKEIKAEVSGNVG